MYALRVQIESRSGGKPSSRKLFLEKIPYDSLPCVRGEQVHSWQSHGVALTTCELGNGTWSVPFPDRSAVSTAREAVMSSAVYCGGMTEGVFPILSAHSKGEHLFS